MPRTISRSLCAVCRNPLHWLRRLVRSAHGVTAVEFAIAAPVVLGIGIGLLKFGVAMSQYIALTNAAAQGATTFALSRGTTQPFTSTKTAVSGAAANLASGSITTTVKVNGTACTTDSGCSALLVAGATALVKTTYPCDLTVMGVDYKPNCTLSAQSAQMVQ
jgi:Flp pilus assembly protein TadG